jgi:hypothetical protein
VSGNSQNDNISRAAEQWNLPAYWIQKSRCAMIPSGDGAQRAKAQRAVKTVEESDADVLQVTRQ